MTSPGYLSRLVLRSTRSDTGLRPRPSAVYEAPTADFAVRRALDDRSGPSTPAEPALAGEVATELADEEHRVSREPRTRLSWAVSTVGERQETNEDAVSVSSARQAVQSTVRTPVERGDPAAGENDVPRSAVSGEVKPGPTVSRRTPATQQARPGTQQVVAGNTEQELQTNEIRTRADRDVSEPDRATKAGAVAAPSWAHAGGTVGPASQGRGETSQVPAGSAWSEPVPVVPRLEVPMEVGEPDVNVTIGRIEIVRPTVAEPAPRPVPRRRTTSAPDLAEYLKSRSGR